MGDGYGREPGLKRNITRRDFLNGLAIGTGSALVGASLPQALLRAQAAEQARDGARYYPPTRTGMRGSHDGSWEVAHVMRDGNDVASTGTPADTGERYDLVVVGGGISGLSSTHFYRQRAGALWLRPRRRHRSDHRESLATRLRLRVQPLIRARPHTPTSRSTRHIAQWVNSSRGHDERPRTRFPSRP